jgi:hypothetical protein
MFNGKLGPVVDSEAGICTSKKSPMKFGLLYEMETCAPGMRSVNTTPIGKHWHNIWEAVAARTGPLIAQPMRCSRTPF